MPDVDWNDLRYLLAVARSKTLAAAARKLDVNERTVARRIARVEQQLEAQLFDRQAGKLIPTEMGELAVASAERVEIESQHLTQRVTGADLRAAGSVRLTAVPVLLNRMLIPSLKSLIRQHPELELELIAEPRNLSLSKREADLALRMSRPTGEQRIIARRLGQIDYFVYASRKGDLENMPWINYEDGMRDLPQARWISEQTSAAPESIAAISVNDTEAILATIRAGLGKSLLPRHVGDQQHDLQRLPGDICLSREVWMMVHPDLRHLARIRAVIEWLDELFTKS